MRKITSIAAALAVAASNVSLLSVNASTAENGFLSHQRNDYFENYSDDLKLVNALADKEAEMDFNNDGEFNMWDVYAFFRGSYELLYNSGGTLCVDDDGNEIDIPPVYTVPDYIKENVSKNGDLNQNGELDSSDFDILAYYYSMNYPVSYDFVDPNNYYFNCPDDYNDHDCDEIFANKKDVWTVVDLRENINSYWEKPLLLFILDYVDRTSRVDGAYSTFCDMVDRKIIDLDIDGDGDYTLSDLYDIIEGSELCYWENSPEYGEDEEKEKYGVARNTYFTEEEWEKLKTTCNIARAALGYAFEGEDYFVAYLFENTPFKKVYIDEHYFDDYRGGFFKESMQSRMFDYCRYALPDLYSPRFDYTQDEIKSDFENYYAKVMNGELPEPDINMNGTIEFEDYIYADLILAGEYMPYADKYPEFSPEIIDNFRKNCDFNENEMSGDLSDVISIQLYVIKKLGIPESEIKNEMARYFKKHLEIDIFDYEHYVLPEEANEEQEAYKETVSVPDFDGEALASRGVNSIRCYMSNIELFAPKSGDANNDGNVDMADSVLIMQSLANPDKYGVNGSSENHITAQGRVNGDVNGDGLTIGDAQSIQKMLLGVN